MNSLRIFYLLRECTLNLTSFLRINVEFRLFFANSLSIHYLFRRFTVNSLSVSLIHFKSNIFKSNSSIRINYQFTIFFANSLWIHYLFCEFTINLLGFKQHYLTLSCYIRPNFNLWWLFMTWFDLKLFWISILDKIFSRNICIVDIFRPTGPIWPLLDGFDPSLTSDDPNWPWKILNLNSWENFESKHMYIEYISTNSPDLTLISRFWPKFDLKWPWTGHDIYKFGISKKFPIF